MTEYSNALAYLYNLEKYGTVFGLENIQWILHCIGNPHRFLKTVHIGGTNGKGSVSAMLSHTLKAAGYRVGKYTSPHLVSFTERITINEEEIAEAEVADITIRMRQLLEAIDPSRPFTFFDFSTALAFEYFHNKQVDTALIEVGLGGRLDSTNVVNPLISIITNVAFDHTDYLGDDILDIAKEKAGIIKKGVPVVTGAQGEPGRIIEEKGKESGSPVYILGRDFFFEKKGIQQMSYTGLSVKYDNIYVNLKGDHQLANAAIALCAAELLFAHGYRAEDKCISEAFSQVVWPGRNEVIRERPTVILDGAHNVEGIKALTNFLVSEYPGRRRLLIFGAMKDKEYERMLNELAPCVSDIILTTIPNDRALSPEAMKQYAPMAFVTRNVMSALNMAKTMSNEEDVIVVTGSLYLVGACKAVVDDIF
jgi:dihydrofolate synthase/folylpolyglutamate synthase